MTRRILGLLGALVLCTGASAIADPVTVTGGLYESTSPQSDFAHLVLTGDGFSLRLATDSFSSGLVRCFPCPANPPITLGFSSFVSVANEGGAPGEFNGVPYAQTYFNGGLTFEGPTFSSAVLSATNLTVTAPFTMTGTLKDYASSLDAYKGGPVVFVASLTGSGIATAQFTMIPPAPGQPQLFDLKSFVYEFGPSNVATPEPASFLLLGSGLTAVLFGRSRRKTRRAA